MNYCKYLPIALLTFSILQVGCGQTTAPESAKKELSSATKEHHPSKGPHGGELIELGDEEYHAELIHDENAGSISIYILDGNATKPVAIDAKDLTINVKVNGKATQYKIPASPEAADPKGQSSLFSSGKNDELCKVLDNDASGARLQVMIEGVVYSGKLKHVHSSHSHSH